MVPNNRKRKIDNFDEIIKLLILGNKNSNSNWLTITEEHSGWSPFNIRNAALHKIRTNPICSKKFIFNHIPTPAIRGLYYSICYVLNVVLCIHIRLVYSIYKLAQ